ncbi:AIPR family protein, partial [Salmonella enterica]
IRGLICTVEASEIVRIITNPENPKEVRKEIFNDNVRVYLSRTNKINRRIIETALSDRSPLFWYLNNGITVTCDSFSYIKGKRAPLVELKNIQIVNGGQTSNALFEASLNSEERLEDVLILVRIIETKSQPVSLAIAESTNSQT